MTIEDYMVEIVERMRRAVATNDANLARQELERFCHEGYHCDNDEAGVCSFGVPRESKTDDELALECARIALAKYEDGQEGC